MEQKDFNEVFSNEAKIWKERIQELSIRMRNVRELAEVQIDLFSDRQKLLEHNHKLGQALAKLTLEYRKRRRDQLIQRSERENKLYGANEKNVLIEGDLAELKDMIELVDRQITYINDTGKTIDHMLYGIKERIKLEDHLSGLKSSQ